VAILIFTVCRTFLVVEHRKLALGVLLFAFAIELGQYFDLVRVLGLQHNRLARTVIGTTFDVRDLLACALGIALVLGVEA
jgi:glycopeptide antibiotics resistance protein